MKPSTKPWSRSNHFQPTDDRPHADTEFIGLESCQTAAYCIFHLSASQIRQLESGLSSTFLPNTGGGPVPKSPLPIVSQPLQLAPNGPSIEGIPGKKGPSEGVFLSPQALSSLRTADSTRIHIQNGQILAGQFVFQSFRAKRQARLQEPFALPLSVLCQLN